MAVATWLSGVIFTVSVAACGGVFGGSGAAPSPGDKGGIKEEATLYERLGGVDVLRSLVDEWLLEASSDPRIRDFFADADIAHLKLRLVERLCVQVQGPCLYRGREMYEAHADLGLEDTHIRAFLQALEPAMQRVKIEGAPAEALREVIRGLAEELAIAVAR